MLKPRRAVWFAAILTGWVTAAAQQPGSGADSPQAAPNGEQGDRGEPAPIGDPGLAEKQGPSTPANSLTAESLPWYRRLLVGLEWGPTGPIGDPILMSRANGKEIIDLFARARAEYAVIFIKDWAYAYYNSRVAEKSPALGERDLLRECLDAAEPHKMPVIAYCQVQYDRSSWRPHPEWRMKDQDGKDIRDRLCYRSGYLGFVKQVAAEMMEYDIAGFHFDMLDFGFGDPLGCWCETCKRDFRRQYGIDLPKKARSWDEGRDAWDKMLQFRCDSNAQFCQQLTAFVKSIRDDVAVDFNYHGYPPFSWHVGERPVQHGMSGDFVTAEGLPWAFGHNNPSLISLFMTGVRPDGPVQGVTSRFVFNYHDYTVRPVAEMQWEVSTYLAHGAQCTIVDKANFDGTSDPLVYERIGEVFGEVLKKREYFGYKPVQEVGIYYSSRSRDWYGREDPPKYMGAFWGAHKALMQSHITMGVIMDESVSLDRLRTFPVVYVPNATILSDRETELFDRYVSGGGNLLITGLTGICDRYGNLQDRSMISDLVGARLLRVHRDHPNNYVRLPTTLYEGEGKFLLSDMPPGWPMLTWGPVAQFQPTDAKTYGELMTPHLPGGRWDARMSPKEVVGPAVLIHRRGKGKVVYSPCAIDAAFVQDYRVPEHRNLIRNMVRYLNPHPQVVVQAPRNVEVVVTLDEERKRLLLHLLCFYAPATGAAAKQGEGRRVLPPLMEEEMDYRARVHVQRPFRDVRIVGPDSHASTDGKIIELKTSHAHEVLVVEL